MMTVLFAAGECNSFTGGSLENGVGSFPSALAKSGTKTWVILPLHCGKNCPAQKDEIATFTLHTSCRCRLYHEIRDGAFWYWIEFRQENSKNITDCWSVWFAEAVCISLRYLDHLPNILHCCGAQSVLIPHVLRKSCHQYPELQMIRTVFTMCCQDLPIFCRKDSGRKFLSSADCITAVNLSLAETVSNLYSISRQKLHVIRSGIGNVQNPWGDPLIHRPYDTGSVMEKVFNKLWMQEKHGLIVDDDSPVFFYVCSHLNEAELCLLIDVMPDFLRKGCELILSSSEVMPAVLRPIFRQFPNQLLFLPRSSENDAEIFSSADFFLSLPREESDCTALMLAMRYGTIPIVCTSNDNFYFLQAYDTDHPDGNCFLVSSKTPESFRSTIVRALHLYWNTAQWEELQCRCMNLDFSWDEPVQKFLHLYESLLSIK